MEYKPPVPRLSITSWLDDQPLILEERPAPDFQDLFEFDRAAVEILSDQLLGSPHSCAISCGKHHANGYGFQIMTDSGCSENDFDFFNWYTDNFQKSQFFQTPLTALIEYVRHREEWITLGKPKY